MSSPVDEKTLHEMLASLSWEDVEQLSDKSEEVRLHIAQCPVCRDRQKVIHAGEMAALAADERNVIDKVSTAVAALIGADGKPN